jgi:serine/threonine-protein kinase
MLAGKYRVDRVLGQGGMGVVVAATHTQLDQKVAVKFLLPDAAEHGQAKERFLREARAAVKIQSEFVARVIDVGTLEETGTPYMVMEYLEGTDLEGVIEKQGPLPVEEAVEYVLQACAALAEAHSLGIIHRDLKPANLFRTMRSDGHPVVKVLDFGISKMTLGTDMDSASLTGTAAVLGTPMYMSPEQIRSSRDVDARTDVWSLGSILQELLTGAQPFPADTMPQLFAAILEAQPTPIRSTRTDVPEGLEQVVSRCLSKSPDDRFANVAELAAALAPYGPATSTQLSDRTSRVLGVPGSMVPQTAAMPDPAARQSQTEPQMDATMPAQTGVAWGTTRSEPGSRRLVLVASVVAGLLGVAGIGAALFVSGGSEPEASAEPVAAAAVESAEAPPTPPAESAVAPVDPTPAPTPSVAPILPSAEPEETKPDPKAAPAPAPRPRVARPRPRPAVAPAPRRAPKPAPAAVPRTNPLDIELK